MFGRDIFEDKNMTHAYIEKWNEGRMWIWDLIRIEWSAPTSHLMFHIDFFGGDSERDLSVSIGTKLFYLCIGLEGVLPQKWQPKCDYKTSFGSDRCFGVSYHDAALWLSAWVDENGWSRSMPWYQKVIAIHMPWDRNWVRTSQLMQDGTWEHETPGNNKSFYDKEWDDKKWLEEHPYTYILKSGEAQNRTATISVSEREWRPRWFKWTKLFASISKTIDVRFSDEVGEQTGSWKGGTTGCGYSLRQGETPLECLRRMERERKF